MSLEERTYAENFAGLHSANDDAPESADAIQHDIWLLKTHLRNKGIQGEIIEDGRGLRIADPLEPNHTLIVRDAVAFGYKPTIEGTRPATEYARLWVDDEIPQLDWLFVLDSLVVIPRQEECEILPDDLASPNPTVLREAQKRDEALGATLRLNKRFSWVLVSKNSYVHDSVTKTMMATQTAKGLLASDQYHVVEEVPVLKKGQVQTNQNGDAITRLKDSLKSSFDAWYESPLRRTYSGIELAPEGKTATGEERDAYKLNKWRGFHYTKTPEIILAKGGSATLILDHMYKVFHQGNDATFKYELQWWSHMLQRPYQKPHAHILRFEPTGGTGKDIFQEMIRFKVIGREFSATASGVKQVCDKFNSAFENAIVIFGNEIAWGGSHDARDKLYDETANLTRQIEPKGVDRYEVQNYSRYVLHSNNLRPAPIAKGDRRFLALYCLDISEEYEKGKHDPRYSEYYDNLAAASKDDAVVAAFIRELLSQDLSDFNRFLAPETAAKRDLIERELKEHEAWLLHLARNGEIEGEGEVYSLHQEKEVRIKRKFVQDDAANYVNKKGKSLETTVGTALTGVADKVETHCNGSKLKSYRFPALPEFRAKVAKKLGLTVEQCSENSQVMTEVEWNSLREGERADSSDVL